MNMRPVIIEVCGWQKFIEVPDYILKRGGMYRVVRPQILADVTACDYGAAPEVTDVAIHTLDFEWRGKLQGNYPVLELV